MSRLALAARYFPASVLLLAAFAKSTQLSVGGSDDLFSALGPSFANTYTQLGLVEFELLLALWLVGGFYFKFARKVALIAFVGFLAFSTVAMISGRDCGCFGAARIPAWATVAIDLTCLLLLCVPVARSGSARTGWGYRLAACSVLAFPAAAMASRLGNANSPFVEPARQVGVPLAGLDRIPGAEQLKSGQWLVLFYHHGCPVCQTACEQLEAAAGKLAQLHALNVAFIELPPFDQNLMSTTDVVRLRWANDSAPRARWPVIFRLSSGEIESARSGESVMNLLADLTIE